VTAVLATFPVYRHYTRRRYIGRTGDPDPVVPLLLPIHRQRHIRSSSTPPAIAANSDTDALDAGHAGHAGQIGGSPASSTGNPWSAVHRHIVILPVSAIIIADYLLELVLVRRRSRYARYIRAVGAAVAVEIGIRPW
jgi:hypothetical protein